MKLVIIGTLLNICVLVLTVIISLVMELFILGMVISYIVIFVGITIQSLKRPVASSERKVIKSTNFGMVNE